MQRPIVYLTSGIFGYLYRFLPIGRALQARGHEIVITTPSSDAIDHANAAGFATCHLARQEAALAELDDPVWPEPIGRVMAKLPGLSLGPRAPARARAKAHHAVVTDTTELLGFLDGFDPVLVMTEAEEHRDIRAMLSAGRSVLLFEDMYSVRPGRDVPFPGRSHLVPDGSRISRMRVAAGWQRFFLLHRLRHVAERAWTGGHDWHSALADVGQPEAVDTRYFQYYDYTELPRLRTIAPELAYPGEPQPPTITGPIVDEHRPTLAVDEGFADRWAAMMSDRTDGARIVYVSLGTFLEGFESLVEAVIEATGALANAHTIVSVGKDIDRWRSRTVPDNVAVFGRVPQLAVLANADVCVSTGGLNTGHESLWFGVPILNLMVGGVDARGNAVRLTHHGVGRHLSGDRARPALIRREIETLLDDGPHRARAREIAGQLRAWNGIERAADAVEAVLRQSAVERTGDACAPTQDLPPDQD